MAEKRYAIVRVDGKCPYIVEDFDSTKINNMFKCYDVCRKFKNGSCKTVCRYGDTKEQLIRKVAQAFFRRKLKIYKKVLGGEFLSKKDLKRIYEKCLETAKEIVECLGVK